MKAKGAENLKFRCTGCGNCCREPLLPLTDGDIRRIKERTGDAAADIVRWVDRHGIEMDDEPEAFVMLRQGKRVMVLGHQNGACRYLGKDARCTIYDARPLGCRLYPFDPDWDSNGKLRRLKIVRATECPNEMDGKTKVSDLKALDDRYQQAHRDLNAKIAEWNGVQRKRKRGGKAAQTAKEFLVFLGLA
ncbi:MAG TPA: YkgJ family cysteine cluster protein [Polyangiaceae bacterium]|nr:YkgJ family cysteine cluster protein [Polyangiaceae bacterium]